MQARPAVLLKAAAKALLPDWVLDGVRLAVALRSARRLAAQAGRFEPRANPLPAPLIVSLTSFAPRFATLHLTLDSLLRQSVRPDRILLWIAHEELDRLPQKVRRLASRGIEIRGCPNIRSYKKLIFTLAEHPGSYIATADDDLFYPPEWLEALVAGVEEGERAILCHRAHRIRLQQDGKIAPYASWDIDVQDERAKRPSPDLVATGNAGILYPPGCFVASVTDRALFERLCPTGDDLWFYWMSRMAGWRYKRVGGPFPLITWPSARVASLMEDNLAGGNDRQIRNLELEFGNPILFA